MRRILAAALLVLSIPYLTALTLSDAETGDTWVQAHIEAIVDAITAIESILSNNVGASHIADQFQRFECAFPVQADGSGNLPIAAYQCPIPTASTLLRVYCNTTANAGEIRLYKRAEATPNTGTTNLLNADLNCDTNGEATTSFADSSLAANSILAFGVDAESMGAGETLRVFVELRRN